MKQNGSFLLIKIKANCATFKPCPNWMKIYQATPMVTNSYHKKCPVDPATFQFLCSKGVPA